MSIEFLELTVWNCASCNIWRDCQGRLTSKYDTVGFNDKWFIKLYYN